MPKTREQKKEILSSLKDKIKQSKAIVFAKFDKLGVKDNENLRKELKKENSEFMVAKKTLLDLAFKDENIAGLNPKDFDGKVAAVFGYGDEVAAAKIIGKFKDDKEKAEKVSFLGGILEGRFINESEVTALAKVPSRQELYAKLVGSINSPVSGFVNALAGNLRNLVYVLKSIEEKKQ